MGSPDGCTQHGCVCMAVDGKSTVVLPLKAAFILMILLPSLVASMMDWFEMLPSLIRDDGS